MIIPERNISPVPLVGLASLRVGAGVTCYCLGEAGGVEQHAGGLLGVVVVVVG